MRVKSVLAGEGGARPPPLITFILTSKVAVYAPAEWADTLFHLYLYMYSVATTSSPRGGGLQGGTVGELLYDPKNRAVK